MIHLQVRWFLGNSLLKSGVVTCSTRDVHLMAPRSMAFGRNGFKLCKQADDPFIHPLECLVL